MWLWGVIFTMIKKVLKRYLDTVQHFTDRGPPGYTSYWLSEPHCKKSKPITQVDGKVAYICTHKEGM
jgi:hypothetical protein